MPGDGILDKEFEAASAMMPLLDVEGHFDDNAPA
jgi:hypothetical protein